MRQIFLEIMESLTWGSVEKKEILEVGIESFLMTGHKFQLSIYSDSRRLDLINLWIPNRLSKAFTVSLIRVG